ncbi:ABC transporter ATP-binding protein [Enterococcus sp. LJL128]|uniref:ABC transporter ATP-binding protein n=1 Tax=Enterococcus sp. LJL51 TaxID=3416656 RepID=UPI003CF1A184
MIEVKGVTKRYKTGVTALNHLDLQVNEGEIFTLLGKNGAGKSTLIDCLTTVCQPTAGLIRIGGEELTERNVFAIRRQIACVGQQISIDTFLTLKENMQLQSKLYQVEKAAAEKRIAELIEIFELEGYTEHPIISYSGGVKRRLDIAMSLVSSPKVIFLDEPTVGLDVFSRKALWGCIRKINTVLKTTVFLTTHYLEEAEVLSDRIFIMDKGRKVIAGSRQELTEYLQQRVIQLTFDTAQEQQQAYAVLLQENLKAAKQERKQLRVESENIQLITELLLKKKLAFSGIQLKRPSLEEIFIEILSEKELEK